MSVLTYGIVIWADALLSQKARRKSAPVYRLDPLRVASAYRSVSNDAVCVIAGMMPVHILAEERRSLYRQKGTLQLSPSELSVEERFNSLQRLQSHSDVPLKGRWTHRLIAQVGVWLNREHGEVNFYLTQML
ncbi:uncharacterized protein LOC107044733 [Diachasma alloeum]|uniref:uncharacterized protein LOC107044733 n=1 Tax=Diachasma alloeum TaxID=454923 RepID=UPI0007382ED3|nr:uncharacterized protein LOC107044733 [Diachasma alloeum]